ncbi:MAG: hypothetical protein P4M11_04390 [Candidatus Pacebacteria bacterium]|nr:hypothetical protein [Candidatus Paceibacterota bacterium]
MGSFWDTSAPVLDDDFVVYCSKKEVIKRSEDGKVEENLAALNSEYREKIISLMGKKREEIENEHKRLSRAFGVPVGTVRTLDFRPALSIGHDAEDLIVLGLPSSMNRNPDASATLVKRWSLTRTSRISLSSSLYDLSFGDRIV